MTPWNISVPMFPLFVSARRFNGFTAADGWRRRQTVQPAAFAHHDAPAFRRVFRQATDIEIHAREILTLRERLNGIYVKHTGQSLKEIEKIMERDTFRPPMRRRKSASSMRLLKNVRNLLVKNNQFWYGPH